MIPNLDLRFTVYWGLYVASSSVNSAVHHDISYLSRFNACAISYSHMCVGMATMVLTANGHNDSNAMNGHSGLVSLAGQACNVLPLCQGDLRTLKLSQAPYGLSNNPGRRGRVSEKGKEDRR